jgi:hypothetical protein
MLALGAYSSQAAAQALFSDDFEDRVADQAVIGNNWTWFDQTFEGDTCAGEPTSEFGPWSDGDGSDYEAENRNFFTAGEDDSYFRAGLEVPAWSDDNGASVVMDNMLRVYGNQYNPTTSCERVLIFQEMTIENAGTYTFSFDVAQDRYGAPANGEITAAFVKILRSSDESFATVLFETVITTPPVATSPADVTTAAQEIEFTIPEEMVGELLQFGFYNDLSENLGQSWGTSAALYDNVMLAPLDIGPAHSGSFYNIDQSGHGFSVEFGQAPDESPYAVVYWYTYDDLGNPIFMLGEGIPVGTTLEVSFQSPVGMQYGVFDPDSVTREDGGTAVFEFSDRDNATFSYTPSEFSASEWGHMTPIESLPLIKLFGIPADKYFGTPD